MTMLEIMMACVGLILCSVVFAGVGIVVLGIIWWVFKTDMDIDIDTNDWEEEE